MEYLTSITPNTANAVSKTVVVDAETNKLVAILPAPIFGGASVRCPDHGLTSSPPAADTRRLKRVPRRIVQHYVAPLVALFHIIGTNAALGFGIAAVWLGRVQQYFGEYGCWFVLVALFLKNILFLGPVMPGAQMP